MSRLMAGFCASVLRSQSSTCQQGYRSLCNHGPSQFAPAFTLHASDSHSSSGRYFGFGSMLYVAGFAAFSSSACCTDTDDESLQLAAQPRPHQFSTRKNSSLLRRSAASRHADDPQFAEAASGQATTSAQATASNIATAAAHVKGRASDIATAQARINFPTLVQRLSFAGVSTTYAATGQDFPMTHTRYIYSRPKPPGHFSGLTAAQLDTLAATNQAKMLGSSSTHKRSRSGTSTQQTVWDATQPSPHTTFLAGTPEAERALSLAEWEGALFSVYKKATISEAYSKLVDVVLVDTTRFRSVHEDIINNSWGMQQLRDEHGYHYITRPSLLVNKETNFVMGVFLNGEVMPELCTLAADLPELHAKISKRMPHSKRRGLHMLGFRANGNRDCQVKSKKNLRTGYYCARTPTHAAHLKRDLASQAFIVNVAAAICNAEKALSPSMAAHRMQHAKITGHPGLFPGVPHKKCPAPSIAVSKGYRSLVHGDEAYKHMSETIVFSSKGVPARSGYCFAVVDAGIVFDLLAGGDSSMVMVPGTVRHGTPALNPGCDTKHAGIGAVVIGKENLTRAEARKDTKWICERLDDGNTCNPYVAQFALRDEMRCKRCKGLKSPDDNLMFACDECNDGYHTKCMKPHPTPVMDKAWYCCECAPIVKKAEQFYKSG